MKILYIESLLKNPEINISDEEIKKLPKNIFLVYTIQYKKYANKLKKKLKDYNIKISGFQQILGCSKVNTKDPLLYMGTGKFHAINLFLQSPAIYIIVDSKIKQIPSEEIESQRNKRKAAFIKYLNAENIGILVSTKPGQENIMRGVRIKEKMNKKGKRAYIFLSSNIDINQFENFNIDSWINTACPGLSYDNSSIINSSEISDK